MSNAVIGILVRWVDWDSWVVGIDSASDGGKIDSLHIGASLFGVVGFGTEINIFVVAANVGSAYSSKHLDWIGASFERGIVSAGASTSVVVKRIAPIIIRERSSGGDGIKSGNISRNVGRIKGGRIAELGVSTGIHGNGYANRAISGGSNIDFVAQKRVDITACPSGGIFNGNRKNFSNIDIKINVSLGGSMSWRN